MQKSVYKYAAEAGLPVGLYLTMMSACILLSLKVPMLPLFTIPLLCGLPFLLGYYMKRMYNREPAYRKFSALWLCGIYAIIFGTLICSLFSGIYLTILDPGFIHAYVDNAITSLEASPVSQEYEETIRMMRRAMDEKMLPGGMQFVTSMGWLTCFAGSVISMAVALILSITTRQKTADMFR